MKHVRSSAVASISRLWRWEFWPMWAFYAPPVLWTAWLALRYGGYGTVSAANPGIPDGGIVGESKYDILRRLPREVTLATVRVAPGAIEARIQALVEGMRREAIAWPIVLKPDVGQRGTGVRLVKSSDDARRYLSMVPVALIAQPYHPGPFEAGVFYYRMPAWRHGRILSITDKCFPAVIGDGVSSTEDLIRAHPRYRMQTRTFLARLGRQRDRVPAPGERVPIGMAGNHAQGAMFRDGAHLITSALCDRIDEIAKSYEGFYVGRFDIRYSDLETFKAGRDLAIVELNGATAESTNVYDPAGSLLGAWRLLCRQWSIVFAIGAANRARGAMVSSPRRLLSLVRDHLTSGPLPIAD